MIIRKKFTLSSGSHPSPDDGLCLMEAVAFLAGDPHSDLPQCACPVLANFGRVINDELPDHKRDRYLVPLIPLLVGTRSPRPAVGCVSPEEQARGDAFSLWAVKHLAPALIARTVAKRYSRILETGADLAAAEQLICAIHDTLVEEDEGILAANGIGAVAESLKHSRLEMPEKGARYAAHAAILLAKLNWSHAVRDAWRIGPHPMAVIGLESAKTANATWDWVVSFFRSEIIAARNARCDSAPVQQADGGHLTCGI